MLLSTYKSHGCQEWNPAHPGVQHLSPADTRAVVAATMEKQLRPQRRLSHYRGANRSLTFAIKYPRKISWGEVKR